MESGLGMVAKDQLPKGHELGQEARAHARRIPSVGMICPVSSWARASMPEPHVLKLGSVPRAQHAWVQATRLNPFLTSNTSELSVFGS
jgi:hypothetical protein